MSNESSEISNASNYFPVKFAGQIILINRDQRDFNNDLAMKISNQKLGMRNDGHIISYLGILDNGKEKIIYDIRGIRFFVNLVKDSDSETDYSEKMFIC